jgi:hypothetical protein
LKVRVGKDDTLIPKKPSPKKLTTKAKVLSLFGISGAVIGLYAYVYSPKN